MKILILPVLVIATPLLILFFVLKQFNKTQALSVVAKIVLGLLTITIGLVASYFAILISIDGMAEKGISCMSGIAVFIPLSLLINFIGIPYLLISFNRRVKINLQIEPDNEDNNSIRS